MENYINSGLLSKQFDESVFGRIGRLGEALNLRNRPQLVETDLHLTEFLNDWLD